jgi:ribosomal protein S18 acetylase RimI-like enzyme
VTAPAHLEPSPEYSAALAAALPADTFAQICGLGGLVVEVVTTPGAALWRGHPWGTGWAGGGEHTGVAALVDQVHPPELTVPATLPLPPGYRRGWGWGWHATRTAPPPQPHEDRVAWLDPDDPELADLVARAFPDAETPPGDPRVAGWFGARDDGRLVTAAASLRVDSQAAVLSSLTVDPTARRAGWARAVTAWFVRERLAAGVRVVGLGTYLSNAPARALYTRLGFLDVPYEGGVREG